ncbi:MAG: lasso RiPP family leader peptide-containing protein [Gaiellales bacterium]
MEERKDVAPAYEKPEVKDYGDLRELTATQATGTQTDVPKGTPVPPFTIFS